ncbi:MAG: molecular chaperone DnaJ [Deltaproteobacteria bacterium]|nr:molecular chaperone DnaJ [Deltaproteobacteria bacterium]
MPKRDYYEVLGVPRDADADTIKKAYRRAALDCHPDRNPGDHTCEERFKDVSEAYQVLSDPQKRELYDHYGHDGLSGAGYTGFTGVEDIFDHFEDVFSDFFGFGGSFRRGRPRRQAPRPGRDIRKTVNLTLREAAFGTTKTVHLGRPGPCPDCGGSGARRGTSPETCGTCRGRGQVAHSRGAFVLTTSCGDCGGTGVRIPEPCARCEGGGQVLEEREIEVAFPPGIDDGVSIRILGEGSPGTMGGPPGNLLVTAGIEPDPVFKRDGDDLVVALPLAFARAALGATVRVPTLEGETELEIPPGTQPHENFRLPGLGVPHLRGRGRGDLVVVVTLTVPRKLSRKQKKLLTTMLEEEETEE